MIHQRHHLASRLVVLVLGIGLWLQLRSKVAISQGRHLSSFCKVLGGGSVLQTLCLSSEYTVCVGCTVKHHAWFKVVLPTVFFVVLFILSAHLVATLEFTRVRILVMIWRYEFLQVMQVECVHWKTLGAFSLTVDSPLASELHHLLALNVSCWNSGGIPCSLWSAVPALAEPGRVQITGRHGGLDWIDWTSLFVNQVQVGDLMKSISFR